MSRIFIFLLGIVVGGVGVFGGQKYHIVHAKDGMHLVPKLEATFSEVYVDVREFTPADWHQHPAVAAALVRDGKSHVMQGAVIDTLGEGAERFFQSLRR